jgi:hypothetical protein
MYINNTLPSWKNPLIINVICVLIVLPFLMSLDLYGWNLCVTFIEAEYVEQTEVQF